MREYPAEFNEVLKSAYPSLASKRSNMIPCTLFEIYIYISSFLLASLPPSLPLSLLPLSLLPLSPSLSLPLPPFPSGSAEKLFTQCDDYADTVKRKGQIWPLQNTLLLLCPVRP